MRKWYVVERLLQRPLRWQLEYMLAWLTFFQWHLNKKHAPLRVWLWHIQQLPHAGSSVEFRAVYFIAMDGALLSNTVQFDTERLLQKLGTPRCRFHVPHERRCRQEATFMPSLLVCSVVSTCNCFKEFCTWQNASRKAQNIFRKSVQASEEDRHSSGLITWQIGRALRHNVPRRSKCFCHGIRHATMNELTWFSFNSAFCSRECIQKLRVRVCTATTQQQ